MSTQASSEVSSEAHPQLTRKLTQKYIGENSYEALLEMHSKWKETDDVVCCRLFREGLDILDPGINPLVPTPTQWSSGSLPSARPPSQSFLKYRRQEASRFPYYYSCEDLKGVRKP